MCDTLTEFECCTKKEWCKFWRKHEHINTFIGLDLWYTTHGLRDCLLIDHVSWKHYKIIQLIKQFSKTHSCAKILDYFCFDDQLFVINNIKFKQRLLNDYKNKFINYLFINVSPNIEKPIICNQKQLLLIHSSLKQIEYNILNGKDNKLKRKINNNNNDNYKSFSFKSKRKKRKKKQNNKYNNNNINNIDVLEIKQFLYPTICGYLLNYAFIYFTNDIQLNC
eukprot:544739_1